MAKQSVQLNDFSGGINKSSAARDIEGNESTEIKNFSVERPGIIQLSPISRESDKYDTSIISESKPETTGNKPKPTTQANEPDEDVINIRKLAGIN